MVTTLKSLVILGIIAVGFAKSSPTYSLHSAIDALHQLQAYQALEDDSPFLKENHKKTQINYELDHEYRQDPGQEFMAAMQRKNLIDGDGMWDEYQHGNAIEQQIFDYITSHRGDANKMPIRSVKKRSSYAKQGDAKSSGTTNKLARDLYFLFGEPEQADSDDHGKLASYTDDSTTIRDNKKKKSVKWERYFGYDKRSGPLDNKLEHLKDLIVDETVKYTGAHSGDRMTRSEMDGVKDNVLSRLATVFAVEKLRHALDHKNEEI